MSRAHWSPLLPSVVGLPALVGWLAVCPAHAATLQVPEGGRPVPLGAFGVVCGPAPEGWSLGAEGRTVRPPAPDAPGARIAEVKVAADRNACARHPDLLNLVATGAFPDVDPATVVLHADEGQVEVKGRRLKGMQILWNSQQEKGGDVCLDPQPSGKQQQCAVPVARDLPGDVELHWLPARARLDSETVTYDETGGVVPAESLLLRPVRVVFSRMFAPSGTVDVSQGPGRVALLHPEAVSSVDCGQARCELVDGAVVVRSFSATATSVNLRLRLRPRFFLAHGEALDSVLTTTLPLLHCPLAIVSGPPLRDTDDARVIVRMDARCGAEARLRWLAGGMPAEAIRSTSRDDTVFFLVRIGRVTAERFTLAVVRGDLDGTVVGVVESPTTPAPRPRVSLELPKHGPIDFIPTNRHAVLSVAGAGEHARFVPLAVAGAYTISAAAEHKGYLVRGETGVTGFVSLRLGYRPDHLPKEFSDTDLAIIDEHVQRALREANVPAPFATSVFGERPLVELVCAGAGGQPESLKPGVEHDLPFAQRSTCRVLIHRERIRPEDGEQEILIDVDVTQANGKSRGDAELHQRMILRPDGEMQVVPLKGGTQEFDHIVVRVSHVIDEVHYTISPLAREGLPSVQWSVTIKGGWARLYATVTIPAGLYRVTSPSGQLTLNFGVLSRLALLDRHGKERIFGLELGLMGMGLIQPANATPYPATLGAVGGLGIRLPLGGGESAVGIHLWGVYEFRGRYAPDPNAPNHDAPHWALIFGPSISIGDVGANL